ncbi:His-Xaa-Ser system radical SAM maturase HxsC [Photobacterium phosphoreum]|jgi:His-Xaa-Ser system radical SAM maturase HxsC|uniref:His-Xaa-Ser system radical SAM maturase HxsC n=1 Tax=Photobacterium phosphoreum TaxID=659 RepID=UPI0007F958AA|nr:His-Xaa-Ser system radical SAM maturase HxsC [Photobacterium phosphoreum]OBU47602.1 His-Xaa-Ser system radical SAM maturase HxsC [Photobacterium phosphoreum]
MTKVKISFTPYGGVKRKSFSAQIGLAVSKLTETCKGKNLFYLYHGGVIDQELLNLSNLVISSENIEVNKDIVVIKDSLLISEGSVINISEGGKLRILFDPKSHNNALFVTDACNNYCIMCPQPPKPTISLGIKEYLINIIDLIRNEDSPETLGITGGEPTVINKDLIDVIIRINEKFPNTIIQLLSNGRIFAYQDYTKAMSAVSSNMFIGIPIFGATSEIHDFIVQSKGAFNQTIAGIYECRRNKIDIELRVVLHKYTIKELELIIQFIKRTLPFVNHVALMGMENMGFAKMNYNDLWIDPIEYKDTLRHAVIDLNRAGISTSIFNLPFCVLASDIWDFSKQSISDYKTNYLKQCNECIKRDDCAGLFSSTNDKFRLTKPENINLIKDII